MSEDDASGDTHLELSIVIVSYNTRVLTLSCLRSLFAPGGGGAGRQVIVIDNASQDGSADAIEAEFGGRLELLRSERNLGFARANNQVIETRASGEWVLLLNPDTEVFKGSIDHLLAFGKSHPDGGLYGGRTLFPDGSLNIASCWNHMSAWSLFCQATGLTHAFRHSRWFDPEAIGGFQRDRVRRVDIVVGCLLLCRRSLWRELGGFDTRYWMYGEEADLAIRASRLGYRPLITPDATIMHIVGASVSAPAEKLAMVAKARATLVRRHWSTPARQWGLLMMRLGSALRRVAYGVASLVQPTRFGDRAATWAQLWSTRREWLAGYPRDAADDEV